jgi:hypothetical protein
MRVDDVKQMLSREPFVPLKVFKTDGSSLEIPFKHVAVLQSQHLLVFKGVKSERSRYASQGFEAIGYDYIDRIEPRTTRGGSRSKRNGRK